MKLNLINESSACFCPFSQFNQWFSIALDSEFPEPNAAVLSTSSYSGQPTARVILVKDFSINGFVFYTNYESRKGLDLQLNPKASLLFYWPILKCQVRIQGIVKKISSKDSDFYFRNRPVESRINAIASFQSKPVKLENLEEKVRKLSQLYKDNPPRPSYWGGFCLVPNLFEFWQEGKARLHNRIVYIYQDKKDWKISRISP